MFNLATNFNQNIGGWDVTAVTNTAVSLKKEILSIL